MKLRIKVTLSSDDETASASTDNEISVATNIPGLDPAAAKQDFIAQAENLVRIISESQIPAMYADVASCSEGDADPEEVSPQQRSVRDKLRAIKARKSEQETAADENPEGEE